MNTKAAVRCVGFAGAALVAAASSLTIAAPAQAAPGIFRYEGYADLAQRTGEEPPPEPKTIMNPAAGECIKTPNGGNAENYTLSAVVLYLDDHCDRVATTVGPFETDASPFLSIMAKG